MKTFSKVVTIAVPDDVSDHDAINALDALTDTDDVEVDLYIYGLVESEPTKKKYGLAFPEPNVVIVHDPNDPGYEEMYDQIDLWQKTVEAFLSNKCSELYHIARHNVAHDTICAYCGESLRKLVLQHDLERLNIDMYEYSEDAVSQTFTICCIDHTYKLSEVFNRLGVEYIRTDTTFNVKFKSQ